MRDSLQEVEVDRRVAEWRDSLDAYFREEGVLDEMESHLWDALNRHFEGASGLVRRGSARPVVGGRTTLGTLLLAVERPTRGRASCLTRKESVPIAYDPQPPGECHSVGQPRERHP